SARLDGQRPRFGARLAFNRLNLDELLGTGTVEAAPAAAPPAGTPSTEPAPAAPALTLPEGFDANLDLAADALVWRGGLIQQARVNAILENGEVMVNQASAQLPGGSDVNLFGYVHLAEGRPVVDGAFDAASDNLRSLLDWLKIDLHAVPADRLRKFSASGKLKGAPADLQLSGLDMRLDTARLNGAATLRFGERLAVGANLVVDNLNVDAYRIRADRPEAAPAQPPQPQPDQAPAAQPAAQPADKAGQAGLPALGRFDANLKARIEQATWNGVAVQDVRLDATLLRGTLTLREAALGDVGGAALSLTGAVAAIDRVPELRHLAYDLRSRQPGKFFRLLGWHPDFTDRLSALALTGTIDGNAEAVVV
ncbi:MAG: hypothetical protein K2Q10_11310, partial [Rhodospirillales bacterium]|nr:hypothetical protein [Rhodospirillales bacterium]